MDFSRAGELGITKAMSLLKNTVTRNSVLINFSSY